MNEFKLILILSLIFTLSSEVKAQEEGTTPIGIAYSFAKAISTKDTVLLDKIIAKEEIVENINIRYKEGIRISDSDIYFFFFLRYSPWKLKKGTNLYQLRDNFWIDSKLEISITNRKKGIYSLKVTWDEARDGMDIYIKKQSGKWKIIDFFDATIKDTDPTFSTFQ